MLLSVLMEKLKGFQCKAVIYLEYCEGGELETRIYQAYKTFVH